MKLFDFLWIYITLNLILRVIIFLSITVLIKTIYSVVEAIKNKFTKIVKNRVENNVAPNCLRNSILIEINYILESILISISIAQLKYLQSESNREKLNTGKVVYFASKLKNIFKICLFNIILALCVYSYLSDKTIQVISFQYIYYIILNAIKVITTYLVDLNINIKYGILILLLIPLLSVIYDWVIVVYKYREKNRKLLKKYFVKLRRNIHENIDNGNRLKYEGLHEMINSITANIGFELVNSKLKVVNGRHFHIRNSNIATEFYKIYDDVKEVCNMITYDYDQDNYIEKNTYDNIIIHLQYQHDYFLKNIENRVLDYENNNRSFKECRDFFQNNKNQVYKHLFTNAKVIRKEPLQFLDIYIEKAEKCTNKYKKEINEYIYKLLMLRIVIIKKYLRAKKIAYKRNLIDTTFFLIRIIIQKYLDILFSIIY